MRKVPDPRPKNLFGYFEANSETVTQRTRSWNRPSQGYQLIEDTTVTDSIPRSVSHRDGKTNNLPFPIAGTSTLYLPQTSYSRRVIQRLTVKGGMAVIYGFDGPTTADPRYIAAQREWNSAPMRLMLQTEPGMPQINLIFGGLDDSLAFDQNLRNMCRTECLLKLKDQKANVGENLATAMRTARLFTDAATDLMRAYKGFRRFNFHKIPNIMNLNYRQLLRTGSKRVAEDYLKYIYGIRPLMLDVHGLHEMLKEQVKPALIIKARKFEYYGPVQHQADSLNVSADMWWRWRYERTMKVECRIHAKISNTFARDISRVGLMNPAALAWELTPMSFLLDWSLPIGNVLNALDATVGLEFVTGSESLRISGTSTCTGHPESPGTRWKFVDPPVMARYEMTNRRYALSGFPMPLPYVKNPFSGSHVVTALALFRTNWKKWLLR